MLNGLIQAVRHGSGLSEHFSYSSHTMWLLIDFSSQMVGWLVGW
jgi:hypothetical protein